MSNEAAIRRFENLIRARSGLQMREQEAALLGKTLVARTLALRLGAPERYLDFLAGDTTPAQSEWNHLFVLLTNQESYFFRDAGQLSVIREHVLPELVRRNRASRTLRIWSAGCSTGQEPFSLAMMLDDALPEREAWRVLILGTDLSEAALESARAGIYGAWSFRALDAGMQKRFFLPRGNQWEVTPALRRAVTFSTGNLLLDAFPSGANSMHDMDLIVCRNVFIYFAREAVSRVLDKFSATLRPGGFLVTGHTELHDVPLRDLQTRAFPQSVVYQRPSPPRDNAAAVAPLPKSAPLRATPAATVPVAGIAARPNPKPEPRLPALPEAARVMPEAARVMPDAAQVMPEAARVMPEAARVMPEAARVMPEAARVMGDATRVMGEAKTLIQAGRHALALQKLEALLKREPRLLGALCLAAQAQANSGCLDEAEAFCREATEVAPFAPLPYHVLARISEERGEVGAAKILLKKVIYLDPDCVRAFLELGAIYAREGDSLRAAQMRRSALGALENLGEACIPTDEFAVEAPLTAGELRSQLKTDAL